MRVLFVGNHDLNLLLNYLLMSLFQCSEDLVENLSQFLTFSVVQLVILVIPSSEDLNRELAYHLPSLVPILSVFVQPLSQDIPRV